MSTLYILYTVRGARETYYASVDWETGQVFTAPTRDGAIQQAKAAGLESFKEKSISKDELLQALGIGGEMKIRPSTSPRKSKPAPPVIDPSARTNPSGASWFVAGDGGEDGGVKDRNLPIPRPVQKGRKHRKGKPAAPFSASRPISSETTTDDSSNDLFILPSNKDTPTPPPFSDQTPDLPKNEST